jgi:hypothetical protein
MSHFYLTASNTRGGEVTAAGHKTGQTAHLRSWSAGVRVQARHTRVGSTDEFEIFASRGSNNPGAGALVGLVKEASDGSLVLEAGAVLAQYLKDPRKPIVLDRPTKIPEGVRS